MTGTAPIENLAKPIVRQRKTASAFIKNMQHPFRGGKVNYLREPSFRGWIMAGIPFYALAIKKRIPLWRWLLLVVPHLHLLDGEANNTAHEESIRSHRRHTWHFRNAMDSSSFSVLLRAAGTIICAIYALFGPDPWQKNSRQLSLEEQLDEVVKARHKISGEIAVEISPAKKAALTRKGVNLIDTERKLRIAVCAQTAESKLKCSPGGV